MQAESEVILLSSSTIKLEAVRQVFPYANVRGVSVDVPFNPEQPIEPYGIVCAKMRLQTALQQDPEMAKATWIVSIESSARITEKNAEDLVNIVLFEPAVGTVKGYSGEPIEFPREAYETARQQSEVILPQGISTTCGEILDPENPQHWHLSRGHNRVKQICDALTKCLCRSHYLASMHATIRYVQDFPKPGVLFQDSTTLLQQPALDRVTIPLLQHLVQYRGLHDVNYVAGIESRGFTFAMLLRHLIPRASFLAIRKAGKLPPPTLSATYETEYSTDTLEIAKQSLSGTVLIVDDLVATGGSFLCAIQLIQQTGAMIRGCFAPLKVHAMWTATQKKFPIPLWVLDQPQ